MSDLQFDCDDGGHRQRVTLADGPLVIAGWTGRDAAAVEHHIAELERLGVPRPSSVPLYYRVARSLLTQSAEIEALGPDSSGEAEPVLLRIGGRWWLTVGSDHTDRRVEAYSVAVSKQMCAKPLAGVAWPLERIAGHADSLRLRSQVHEHGRWATYQQGTLASIRPLPQLIAGLPLGGPPPDGTVVFCGTLIVHPDAQGNGVRPASRMRLELEDPRTGATISHEYAVRALPIVS
ncbi:MAG TPA: DUF2848 domain-containing protein [Burkholderiaceae bacterium]|jgi:hypothetical protein|nr:DUF2848 domain-containing protein [Burkholderiaceae bacterium]